MPDVTSLRLYLTGCDLKDAGYTALALKLPKTLPLGGRPSRKRGKINKSTVI